MPWSKRLSLRELVKQPKIMERKSEWFMAFRPKPNLKFEEDVTKGLSFRLHSINGLFALFFPLSSIRKCIYPSRLMIEYAIHEASRDRFIIQNAQHKRSLCSFFPLFSIWKCIYPSRLMIEHAMHEASHDGYTEGKNTCLRLAATVRLYAWRTPATVRCHCHLRSLILNLNVIRFEAKWTSSVNAPTDCLRKKVQYVKVASYFLKDLILISSIYVKESPTDDSQ